MKSTSILPSAAFVPLTSVLLASNLSTVHSQSVPVVQEHYVKPVQSSFNQKFGVGVAAHGDTFVVAAPDEQVGGSVVGALYVFVRDGAGWTQEARIENPLAGSVFVDETVALWGDEIVWGAVGSVSGVSHSGCALTFTRSGGTWTFLDALVGSNTESGDFFGASVALYDDVLVVGAHSEDSSAVGVNGDQSDNSLARSGAVYVFRRVAGIWVQEAYLKASNTQFQMGFGSSLACYGSTIAVGAQFESTSWIGSGAAYVFTYDGTDWSQEAFLKPSNPYASGYFGETIALHRDSLVVGAPNLAGPGVGIDGWPGVGFPPLFSTGSAYLFTRDNGVWTQEHVIKASNTHAGMEFGRSLAINDEHILIGTEYENGLGSGVNADQAVSSVEFYDSGAAYLFDRRGPALFQSAYLKGSNTTAVDFFGAGVALLGGTAIIGAPGEDSGSSGFGGDPGDNSLSSSGAAYIFDVNGPDPSATSRSFGSNAQSYTAELPELGTTWTGTVDLSTTGHSVAALVFFLEPNQVGPLWNDQWLLVGQTFPVGELLGLAPEAGPQATFEIEIPLFLPLLGQSMTSQAVHFGGVQPIALSNAQDLVLGS